MVRELKLGESAVMVTAHEQTDGTWRVVWPQTRDEAPSTVTVRSRESVKEMLNGLVRKYRGKGRTVHYFVRMVPLPLPMVRTLTVVEV
jgi:hypothetical protein